ncbi:MAG TPA: protocatechuate 3,4-dioxygenase subunit alpha [Xanthobacteraceae bacterium]|nr:protocatechuate 3,4-dioxygenase subunit alpha [Xanthobacteraceae bacterium]
MAGVTPSQTVGPYFSFGLDPKGRYDWVQTVGNDLVTADATGERILIEGRVLDGDGAPVNDAMLEIWQADAAGRYAHPADQRRPNAQFKGFGRAGTDADGGFAFSTIKPGCVAGPDGKPQAPHILVAVFSRGMVRHLYTRLYFEDEKTNAGDPILALVPAERRATLIAKRQDKDGRVAYRFDIRLQGENETVFFDI